MRAREKARAKSSRVKRLRRPKVKPHRLDRLLLSKSEVTWLTKIESKRPRVRLVQLPALRRQLEVGRQRPERPLQRRGEGESAEACRKAWPIFTQLLTTRLWRLLTRKVQWSRGRAPVQLVSKVHAKEHHSRRRWRRRLQHA